MLVPKLVCEVPYASGFAWFVSVDGCLGCEEHDEERELQITLIELQVKHQHIPVEEWK